MEKRNSSTQQNIAFTENVSYFVQDNGKQVTFVSQKGNVGDIKLYFSVDWCPDAMRV